MANHPVPCRSIHLNSGKDKANRGTTGGESRRILYRIAVQQLCRLMTLYSRRKLERALWPRIPPRPAIRGWAQAMSVSVLFMINRRSVKRTGHAPELKEASCDKILCKNGAPKRIRTSGLCLRRAALYPAELWVRAPIVIGGQPLAKGPRSR
jgi:hypothetical protein